MIPILRPTTPDQVQDAVAAAPALRIRGGGSKPALSTPPSNVALLEMSAVAGIVAYESSEFVFTALAGTPVAEIAAELEQHNQYLPFDPMLVERGATLGGVVAANTAGPGRHRFGGVRDFLLGVRFVDGQGQLIRGGGKVVKNAAGFDFPKLMVGSLGRLGVLVELSFKVFPRPPAYATLQATYPSLDAGVAALCNLLSAPLDLEALDLEVSDAGPDAGATLWLRLGGLPEMFEARAASAAGFPCPASPASSQRQSHAWCIRIRLLEPGSRAYLGAPGSRRRQSTDHAAPRLSTRRQPCRRRCRSPL